jgi:hypothetical protein
MKFTLTLGIEKLEATQTNDSHYLRIGHTIVSKRQLIGMGFKIEPQQDAPFWVKAMSHFMSRKLGLSRERVVESKAKLDGQRRGSK